MYLTVHVHVHVCVRLSIAVPRLNMYVHVTEFTCSDSVWGGMVFSGVTVPPTLNTEIELSPSGGRDSFVLA